jgi:two-component system OmpR family sensor kinase/two-component system sensor histidine kinase QseC
LKRLAVELRARDSASLQALTVDGLPDEVLPLVQSLNALLERLGAALAAQRHFVGDAAHELRSPLTALKLQVQLMRRAPDDAARDAAALALTAGVDRATRLVEQLLALARSEAGPPRDAGLPAAAPLAELVRQAMADVGPLAAERGTTLELDVADGAEGLLAQGVADVSALARNLIDNAVRYSPDGGRVAVWVGAEPGEGGAATVLQVDDDGPGIPLADREAVFDRFVRRENAAAQTGSGLGLAIVRQVALRQGAQVTLSDAPLGGLRARVVWPARAAAA